MSDHKNCNEPFSIDIKPSTVNVKDVQPTKGSIIVEANDCFYKVEMITHISAASKILGGLAVACGIWIASYEHKGFLEYLTTYSIIVIGFFFIYMDIQ